MLTVCWYPWDFVCFYTRSKENVIFLSLHDVSLVFCFGWQLEGSEMTRTNTNLTGRLRGVCCANTGLPRVLLCSAACAGFGWLVMADSWFASHFALMAVLCHGWLLSLQTVGVEPVQNLLRGPQQTKGQDKSRANSAEESIMTFCSKVDFYPKVESTLGSLLEATVSRSGNVNNGGGKSLSISWKIYIW